MSDRYNQPYGSAQHHSDYRDGYPDTSGYYNNNTTAYPDTRAHHNNTDGSNFYGSESTYPSNNNAYPSHTVYDKEKEIGSDTYPGPAVTDVPASYSDGSSDVADIDPNTGVRRGLKTRHVSMMALAGIIGPGLLIGSGGALANGGPAALILGFGLTGIVSFSISLGELTTLYPTGGAFTGLADRFVDKGMGVALGYNYFIVWFCVLANEYNVLTSIFTQWPGGEKVPQWGYFLIFWFAFLAFQLLGVETFGEAEFWLALTKLVGLTAYFLFSIVYCAGGVKGAPAIGHQYWDNPGAFADGFRGVAKVFVFASTFYAGVESIAVAATETRNPRRAVPIAIRQTFWRIIYVYMLSAIFFGLTCPYNDPGLIGGGSKALMSPMTIAIRRAGWDNGVYLINAFIFVTCLSACNSSIYIGSRTLLYMGQNKKAPKILGWTDRRGVPIPAIIFTNACGALSMMNVSTGAAEAYKYIVNLSGVSTFIVWGSISFIHIRFRRGWHAQGHTAAELPFKSFLYPYNAYFGLAANIFLMLIQGWTTLVPFVAGDFVDSYILLPLFFVMWIIYKLIFKTHFWRAHEMDVMSGRRRDVDDVKTGEAYVHKSLWGRLKENF